MRGYFYFIIFGNKNKKAAPFPLLFLPFEGDVSRKRPHYGFSTVFVSNVKRV